MLVLEFLHHRLEGLIEGMHPRLVLLGLSLADNLRASADGGDVHEEELASAVLVDILHEGLVARDQFRDKFSRIFILVGMTNAIRILLVGLKTDDKRRGAILIDSNPKPKHGVVGLPRSLAVDRLEIRNLVDQFLHVAFDEFVVDGGTADGQVVGQDERLVELGGQVAHPVVSAAGG